MPAELNFFDTYTLMAVYKRVVPKKTFFRDRYFPTSDEDIFASNKVLTEYMDGDQKMAAFVAPRVGAIPMERMGYEIHELEPAFIGMSRELSTDDLTKRGFGEAIYANSTPRSRAAKLTQKDLADMDARIVRREEWMCAQTMLDNGCTMQEMIDNQTKGDTKVVKFYNPGHENDHIYVPAAKWNEEAANSLRMLLPCVICCPAVVWLPQTCCWVPIPTMPFWTSKRCSACWTRTLASLWARLRSSSARIMVWSMVAP